MSQAMIFLSKGLVLLHELNRGELLGCLAGFFRALYLLGGLLLHSQEIFDIAYICSHNLIGKIFVSIAGLHASPNDSRQRLIEIPDDTLNSQPPYLFILYHKLQHC